MSDTKTTQPMTAAPLPLVSEERVQELARQIFERFMESHVDREDIELAAARIRAAIREAGEAAAETSPNGEHVSAADAPHIVWQKFSAAIRRRL